MGHLQDKRLNTAYLETERSSLTSAAQPRREPDLGTIDDDCELHIDVRLDGHLSSSQVNDVDDCVIEKVRRTSCGPATHPAALRLSICTLSETFRWSLPHANLSLAFNEVSAATSAEAQSARGVS